MDTQDRLLEDLLVDLLGSQASGCLSASAGDEWWKFYFARGNLVFVEPGDDEPDDPVAEGAALLCRAALAPGVRFAWAGDERATAEWSMDGGQAMADAMDLIEEARAAALEEPAREGSPSTEDEAFGPAEDSGSEAEDSAEAEGSSQTTGGEVAASEDAVADDAVAEGEDAVGAGHGGAAEAEDIDPARKALKRARESFLLGERAAKTGNLAEASAHFRKAVDGDSSNLEYAAWYGYTTFELNHEASKRAAERGLDMLQWATRSSESKGDARLQAVCLRLTARTAALQGEKGKARAMLQKAMELCPEEVAAKIDLERLDGSAQEAKPSATSAPARSAATGKARDRRSIEAAKRRNLVVGGGVALALLVGIKLYDSLHVPAPVHENLASKYSHVLPLSDLVKAQVGYVGQVTVDWAGLKDKSRAAIDCLALHKALGATEADTLMLKAPSGYPMVNCGGNATTASEVTVRDLPPGADKPAKPE